tara:strand:+ start:13855 stop:14070 length:216 start_codon:yes stop_codon:yes gene_type:complete
MSRMIYEIRAYSPSKNEVQREFDQDALRGNPTQNELLAQRKADAFAHRLNLQKKLKANDWQGQIVLISTII